MKAVLLTDEQISQLVLLNQQHGNDTGIASALAQPFLNLLEYHEELTEIISRSKDGSSYIDEDFGDFLELWTTARRDYKNMMSARNEEL